VMAAPDVREEDLSLKAIILFMSISRIYQAIRWFSLNLGCDSKEPSYMDYLARMKLIVPTAKRWTAPLRLESFQRELRGARSAVLVC